MRLFLEFFSLMCLSRGEIYWPLSNGSDARWYLQMSEGEDSGLANAARLAEPGARIFLSRLPVREASRAPFSSCAPRADCWFPGFTSRDSRATYSPSFAVLAAYALRFFVLRILRSILCFCRSLVVVSITYLRQVGTVVSSRHTFSPSIIATGSADLRPPLGLLHG
jgi:hypothetical protein